VVDEAQRTYQRKLDDLVSDGTAFAIYRKVTTRGKGRYQSSDAASDLKLPVEAVQYLISVAANRLRGGAAEYGLQRDEIDNLACKAAYALECVDERNKAREHYRNELTKEEFRRTRHGELVGDLVWLYSACKRVNPYLLDEDQTGVISRFLEVADNTLESRLTRQKTAIKKKMLLKANGDDVYLALGSSL